MMNYDTKKLNSIDILEVAKALGLEVKSKKTNCFLHADKTPSLSFHLKTNTWKCFGCNQSGDVIELVKKKNNLDFKQACQWLECNLGSSSVRTFSTYTVKNKTKQAYHPKDKNHDETQSDPELYAAIINHLNLSDGAKSYLCDERALSPDAVELNNIVSLEDPSELYGWLKNTFNEERLFKAGLLQKSQYGNMYNFWRTTGIIFPYYDINNNVVNLQLRPYHSTKNQKYILLKGIKTCMYNEVVLANLPVGTNVFLCEGAIDVLSMMTIDKVAVGIPGAATLKGTWVEKLRKFNICIIFDNDNAGKINAEKHKTTLISKNINAKIYYIENYKDINEKLIAEKGGFNEQ